MKMIEFFGEPWPSGVCDEGIPAPTPVGELCWYCGVAVVDGDQGTWTAHPTLDPDRPDGPIIVGFMPIHRECSLRAMLGGIGHFTDHGYWCVKMDDPDGGMSVRESALAVWGWVQRSGIPV